MSHENKINDKDPYFEIDPITRAIKNISSSKTTVMQYDHNSERFTFSLPRYIEEHDMLESTKAEIHYINVAAGTKEEIKGIYEISDLKVDPEDENKIICTWLLSQNATKNVGILQFLLRFSCLDDNGEIIYVWNTGIHTGISISTGMYNSEAIVEQYADVLGQWKTRLFEESNQGVLNINQAKKQAIAEIENTGIGLCSNAYKHTVSGTQLEISDISPIVHNTKLKIRSKNRFDYSKAVFNEAICTVEQTETGLKATAKTTNAQSVRMWIPFDGFEVGKTYILSSSLVSKTMGIHLVDTNSATSGITLGTVKDTNQYVFTIPEKKAYLRIYIYNDVAEANEVYYLDNFQIEEGEEITDYEGYISPDTMRVSVNGAEHIPNSDGTIKNVISTYPSMEITSDTPGAIITCEYNRDSNKVIEELTNAIISLGGNV